MILIQVLLGEIRRRDEGKRCINTSKALNLKSTSTAESASNEHYLKSKSEAALDRCRVLAEQIDGDLRNKKCRHLFNNISLLAEFQVSIERAASVLDSIATLTYDQQEDSQNRGACA
jgi:hypothetical protein